MQTVVSTGVFRHIRHPLYLSVLLIYLALMAYALSLYALPVFVGIFIFYNYIASYEEKLLEMQHGDKYLQYKKKTGKWLPRISRA
jgi:protein-S-isoprenylcysteine O-methyltransferase Ste14